jgi:4-azaleucine resistance transporter AzlC
MDETIRPAAPEFSFDLRGALVGARRSWPLAAGVFAYGVPWGVLARAAGLSPLECLLMSALVFAGTAQYVALGLWAAPPPVPALVLTTLVVNLRFVLMGMVAARWFEHAPRLRAHAATFLLTDEVWALTVADVARGGRNAALLPGGGMLLWLAWVTSTTIGRFAGALIVDPAVVGLDVVLVGTLIALLVGMWEGKRTAAPWLAAGVTAVVASRLLPGTWYIGAGCLAGSLLAVVRRDA